MFRCSAAGYTNARNGRGIVKVARRDMQVVKAKPIEWQRKSLQYRALFSYTLYTACDITCNFTHIIGVFGAYFQAYYEEN